MSDTVPLDDLLDELYSEKPEQPELISPEQGVRESYAWATDVFWAYDNLGNKVTKTSAGSAARYALWQMAKKDMENFVGNIMPKAMALLDKSRDKNKDADGIAVKETKAINELQALLNEAIKDTCDG